jgi:TIR domain
MTDVFISYKREERERCAVIADRLRALGLDVWFDAHLESGRQFDTEIEDKIHSAKAVLVLWSSKSVQSTWVRNEASIGQSRDVLVSVELEPCRRPVNFTNTHTVQLHNPSAPNNTSGWAALLRRLERLVGHPNLAPYKAVSRDTAHGEANSRWVGIAMIAAVAIAVLVVISQLWIGAAVEQRDWSRHPDVARNFNIACEAQGSTRALCSCVWGRIEENVTPGDFAALERLPGPEREANPLTAQINGYVEACNIQLAPPVAPADEEPVPAP